MSHKDPETELRHLMSAFAESIVGASDEELLEEAIIEGRDPKQTAQEVKATLLRAVDCVKRTKE